MFNYESGTHILNKFFYKGDFGFTLLKYLNNVLHKIYVN